MEPRGKCALLTGGARIGQEVARSLAARGCNLALTYRGSREIAEESAAAARQMGVRAEVLHADATDDRQVTTAVSNAVHLLGGIDILINMASTYVHTATSRLGLKAWKEAVDSNAKSAFLFSVKTAPFMKQAGAGRIINFSDWTAASGRPRYEGYAPYYVAKTAVTGLTQALALEFAPDILVNSIAPGPILAPASLSDEDNEKVLAATPLRRWGGAAEISRAVLYLIETDFVTGECLRVDGGRHLY